MFRITRTYFRPSKATPYFSTPNADQAAVNARLNTAKKAAPGFVSVTTHRTSPTSMVKVETWDSKESFETFKASNTSDHNFMKTLGTAHMSVSNIKVSVFSETI